MSKSNLGKRGDRNLSQQLLGIEYLDYTLTLKKSNTSEGEMQPTRYSHILSSSSLVDSSENHLGNNGFSGTLGLQTKKKRRSMLGQRQNLYNSDSLYNISKNFQLNVPDNGYENKGVAVNEKKCNSSSKEPERLSPNPEDADLGHRLNIIKSKIEAPKTPPNPFECEDSASNFFDSEINNIGTWSVFKDKREGLKSPSPAFSSKNKGKDCRKFSKSEESSQQQSGKKSFKTKLFDNLCADEKENKERIDEDLLKVIENTNDDCDKTSEHLQWYKDSKEKKTIIKVTKTFYDEITEGLDVDSDSDDNLKTIMNNMDSDGVEDKDDITSSGDLNNETVSHFKSPLPRSVKKTPKLSAISEEDECSKDNLKQHRSSELTTHSPEEHDIVRFKKKDLQSLNDLLQNHSNNIDTMLAELFKEKEILNKYINKFKKMIGSPETKDCVSNKKKKSESNFTYTPNLTNSQRNKKRVISCKIGKSPVLLQTPVNMLASPSSNGLSMTKKKNLYSNSYAELRKNFTCLQTPERKIEKPKSASACYTPKSLSFRISEQLKCLHS